MVSTGARAGWGARAARSPYAPPPIVEPVRRAQYRRRFRRLWPPALLDNRQHCFGFPHQPNCILAWRWCRPAGAGWGRHRCTTPDGLACRQPAGGPRAHVPQRRAPFPTLCDALLLPPCRWMAAQWQWATARTTTLATRCAVWAHKLAWYQEATLCRRRGFRAAAAMLGRLRRCACMAAMPSACNGRGLCSAAAVAADLRVPSEGARGAEEWQPAPLLPAGGGSGMHLAGCTWLG